MLLCHAVLRCAAALLQHAVLLLWCTGEGVPRSILPDHEGRADYHGQSINLAARFMDKGACGGQIACTRELAEHVMAVWAAGGDSGGSSFSSSGGLSTHSTVTGCIEEHQPDSLGAAARQGGAGTGVDSSCDGLQPQPQGAELSQEQAAACSATAAATAGSAAAGSGGGGGSSGGGSSKSRFWWSAFSGASAGVAAAATSAGGTPSAGAATANQAGAPGRERATGASWPGGVTANSQQQQQQQAAGQRVNRLAVAQMRLSRSRSTSQDGTGGGGGNSSAAPVLRSSGSRLLTPRSTLQPVLQGQPSVGCGLLPAAPLLAPAVAPSPFVMRGVVRLPFRVECHRLGLYHFKGGPPQQEMVQVRPAMRCLLLVLGWLASWPGDCDMRQVVNLLHPLCVHLSGLAPRRLCVCVLPNR